MDEAQGVSLAAVSVRAPARLHLGFLDPAGTLGRRFLGLGLAITAPATELRVAPAAGDRIQGPEAERLGRLLARLRQRWRIPPVDVRVARAIPAHAGFGSGTQLALALGMALARLFALPTTPRKLARLLGRGRRSGLGLAAFTTGGFVLDAGCGADGAPPPLLLRLPFPRGWRVLLLRDPSREGLAGAAEDEAFRQLPPFPEATAERLARLAVSCVLPGMATQDLALFGRGLSEIQDRLGDWYAPVQPAGRWLSPEVGRALAWLRAHGIAACGQSSWGPTGFAVLAAAEAGALRSHLRAAFPALAVEVVRGRNRGASLRTLPAEGATLS